VKGKNFENLSCIILSFLKFRYSQKIVLLGLRIGDKPPASSRLVLKKLRMSHLVNDPSSFPSLQSQMSIITFFKMSSIVITPSFVQ